MLNPIGRIFSTNNFTTNSITQRKPYLGQKADTVSFGGKYLPYDTDFVDLYEKIYDIKNIERIIKKDKDIKEILEANGCPVKLNTSLKYDKEFTGHIWTTYKDAIELGKKQGLNKKEMTELARVAIAHDIGKFLIPPEILNKNGPLTPDERKIINLHATLGALILKNMHFPQREVLAVNYHHGVKNIAENQLLLKQFKPYKEDELCEILKVADIYSALTMDRCYRKSMPLEKAFEIMEQNAKTGLIKGEVLEVQEKIAVDGN